MAGASRNNIGHGFTGNPLVGLALMLGIVAIIIFVVWSCSRLIR